MEKKLFKEAGTGATQSYWNYNLSFISDMGSVVEHYHHCYKVAVTLDNPYECRIDGQVHLGLRGFVVNQMVSHSCFAPDANVLVNFIESDSLLGKQLGERLAGKSWLNIDEVLAVEQYSQALPANYSQLNNQQLIPYVETFLESLLYSTEPVDALVTDERLQVALDYIDQNLQQKMELDTIADKMNLSPERVRHIFAQEMGIPFSQYVLWQRIRNTMAVAILEESKLTEACMRFGFTDQPHFNKAFKRIFGLNPNSIISYCRVIL